jgi:hypothetical protein
MKTSNEQRQTCKCCGKRDYFNFHVPDEIWLFVVPPELSKHVVCLPCFDKLASKKNFDYSPHIKEFYFVGDQVTFEFHTDSHTFEQEGT